MNTLDEVNKLFLDHPDGELAQQFLQMYNVFAHFLDDLIDKDIDVNGFNISKVLYYNQNIYAHPFYLKYMGILFPVMRIVHNTYFDTVKMETNDVKWQQEYAKVLKQCGDEVFLAIIEIVGGYDKRMELGVGIRENSWKKQNETL